MPALLLLLRIGRMPFSLPILWFPVWLVLLPPAILGQLVGSVAPLFTKKPWAVFQSGSIAAWSLLPGLSGLQIVVTSLREKLQLKFI